MESISLMIEPMRHQSPARVRLTRAEPAELCAQTRVELGAGRVRGKKLFVRVTE